MPTPSFRNERGFLVLNRIYSVHLVHPEASKSIAMYEEMNEEHSPHQENQEPFLGEEKIVSSFPEMDGKEDLGLSTLKQTPCAFLLSL
mmetsp:Transcript_87624/g.244025  ORF Transcript_87624/g.244025 Transcript_87624/m.244025 type:complete len:88 (-) Transcript_87624:102-365(-)